MEQVHQTQWEEAAQHLLALHRPQQAEQLIRRHLAAHPHEAFAHVLLGLAFMRQNLLAEADDAVRQGIALDPQLGDAYYLLSIILFNDSQLPAAAKVLAEALRLNAHSAKYLGQQAIIYNAQSKPQAALQAASDGLAIDPMHTECLVQCVQSLQQLGQTEQAKCTLQRLIHFYPLLPAAHLLCGEEALSRKSFLEAENHLRETLRLEPTHGRAKSKLLLVLIHLGQEALDNQDITRAQTCFQEARQLDSENPAAYAGLRETIKLSFPLKRFFMRFGALMQRLQRKNFILLSLTCIAISFFCVPLLILYSYASIQWRRHPEAQSLRGTTVRNEPSPAPPATPTTKLTGLLLLTVILGGASWLNAADSPALVWVTALVLAVAWLDWATTKINYAKLF